MLNFRLTISLALNLHIEVPCLSLLQVLHKCANRHFLHVQLPALNLWHVAFTDLDSPLFHLPLASVGECTGEFGGSQMFITIDHGCHVLKQAFCFVRVSIKINERPDQKCLNPFNNSVYFHCFNQFLSSGLQTDPPAGDLLSISFSDGVPYVCGQHLAKSMYPCEHIVLMVLAGRNI